MTQHLTHAFRLIQTQTNYAYFVIDNHSSYKPYSEQIYHMTRPHVLQFLKTALQVVRIFYTSFGLVHWDLHTTNILCTLDGRVMLYDFDFAMMAIPSVHHPQYVTLSKHPHIYVELSEYFFSKNHPVIHNIHYDQTLNNSGLPSLFEIGHMYDLYRLFYDGLNANHLRQPHYIPPFSLDDIIKSELPSHYIPIDIIKSTRHINCPIIQQKLHGPVFLKLCIDVDRFVHQEQSLTILKNYIKHSPQSHDVSQSPLSNQCQGIQLHDFTVRILASYFIFNTVV